MAQIIATFNPAVMPQNPMTFTNPLPGGVGTLVFYNDSGITIDAAWNAESKVLPAGMIDIINVCDPAQIISWTQDYILNNVSSWPASIVKVVGYRPDEKLPYSAFPVPLQRTSNVGNSVPIGTSATSVVNDGNAAPTQVVEGTPSGAPGSYLKWNNDGSGIYGGGLITVNASGIYTAIPASAIPASAIGAYSAVLTSSIAAGSAATVVPFDVARTGAFGTGRFQFQLDQFGSLNIYDAKNTALVLPAVQGGINVIACLQSNGGGAHGNTVWCGTTDPAGLAQEGDIWFNA